MNYDHPNYTVLREASLIGIQQAANGELLGGSLMVSQKSHVFHLRAHIAVVGSGGSASALTITRFGALGTASALAILVATGTLAVSTNTVKTWTAPITLEVGERIGLIGSGSAATDTPDIICLWRYRVVPTLDDVDVPAGVVL